MNNNDNKNWRRILIAISVFFIFSIMLYLYLAPVVYRGLDAFRMRDLTLSSARNYYTILSATVTLAVGFFGLLLGYFYYIDKQDVDKMSASLERKRKRLDKLIDLIDDYDGLVDKVINMRFSNAGELKHLRSMISRSFEEIEIMLDLKEKLLGLDNEAVLIILKVNSFIDKSEVIMHINYSDLSEEKMLTVRDDYINLIQDARRVCFSNIC